MSRYNDFGYGGYGGFAPYVPVAQRRANAAKALPKLLGKGRKPAPVVIDGRKIAHSFWGISWCEQMEAHSDFASRLPRGRTYVRNGSVVHLEVEAGKVSAFVSGSEIYKTTLSVKPLDKKVWSSLVARSAGQVSSVVDLLQGRLPKSVLEAIADPALKLFPQPSQMTFDCSCPDYASMCKHVAAVLYGVGARLDAEPELFFKLRGADLTELVAVESAKTLATTASAGDFAGADLGSVFGIELAEAPAPAPKVKAKKPARKAAPPKKAAAHGGGRKKPAGRSSATSTRASGANAGGKR